MGRAAARFRERATVPEVTLTDKAILVLEDGTVFEGQSIGASGWSVGEVVFNTAMTGYQEILTDPSYYQQIVTLTYPHIGNVGTNGEDEEASGVFAAGLIIRDLSATVSNWRARETLPEYLQRYNVVGIAGIDTRKLTRILREKGAQNGCLMAGAKVDAKTALEEARRFPGLKGMDLAKVVTARKPYEWTEASWSWAEKKTGNAETKKKFNVVAYDFGVKRNILRLMVDRGCRVTVVPAQTSASDVMDLKPDGVFLSNGPGDPEPCSYAIAAIQKLLDANVPIFGICLGHQLLGLASGAKTVKMKFGHHGANHPVQDLRSGRVLITSQNHGFTVDESTLPSNVTPTHRSLFDGSLQGIARTDRPAFSFQGHPEASPGPRDIVDLFDDFIALMQNAK